MTIIKPKEKNSYKRFILFFFVVILIGGGGYIYEYNDLAEIRYKIDGIRKAISEIEKDNTDLNNELYSQIDPKNLESIAIAELLTLEKKPEYLSNNQ